MKKNICRKGLSQLSVLGYCLFIFHINIIHAALSNIKIGEVTTDADSATLGNCEKIKTISKGANGKTDNVNIRGKWVKGNAEFETIVCSLSVSGSKAQGGLILRDGLSQNAPFISILATNNKTIEVIQRLKTTDSVKILKSKSITKLPAWLRISRIGNEVVLCYKVHEDSVFTPVLTVNQVMNDSDLAGIVSGSGSSTLKVSSTFSENWGLIPMPSGNNFNTKTPLAKSTSTISTSCVSWMENFNNSTSLETLGFTGIHFWEKNPENTAIQTNTLGDWDKLAEFFTPSLQGNRDQNDVTMEFSLKYPDDRGQTWRENNKIYIQFVDPITQTFGYQLLFKPNRPQDQNTSYDIQLMHKDIVLKEIVTSTITPVNAWIHFRIIFYKSATSTNKNKIQLFYDAGSGNMVKYIDLIDTKQNSISNVFFKYKTGVGVQNFQCQLDNLYFSCAGGLPSINRHPSPAYVLAGRAANFDVEVSSSPPTSYQWKKGGVNIPLEVNPILTISNVQKVDSGFGYSVRVTNSAGSVESQPGILHVSTPSPPIITKEPHLVEIRPGDRATFTIEAKGPGLLQYNWIRNGQSVQNSSSPTYITDPVLASDNGDEIQCVVSNTVVPDAVSEKVRLVVNSNLQAVTITKNLSNLVVEENEDINLEIGAMGSPSINFQWFKNDIFIPDNNESRLTIAKAGLIDNGARIHCIVSNPFNNVRSSDAIIQVKKARGNEVQLSVSGKLLDKNGQPLSFENGESNLIVKLFSNRIGGIELFQEKFLLANERGIKVQNGEFYVSIGKGKTEQSLRDSLQKYETVFLELAVGDEQYPEILTPRTQINSTVYAWRQGINLKFGNGNPVKRDNDRIGTLYVDNVSKKTWKRSPSIWKILD